MAPSAKTSTAIKPADTSSTTPSDASKSEPAADAKPARKDGSRETIESIVLAFILAFLFRTFEAEAFVIPTGSMAPTLYGRHKECHCPQCGTHFEIGASEEIDNVDGFYLPGNRIKHAVCPNCRYISEVKDAPVFKGDRILVNKFTYESSQPKRWDVIVFKYPEDPKTNYIKRLIGLPGETLEIRQGDIYLHRDGALQIQRKPDPDKQRELQLLVYDDTLPPRRLLEQGWPERWAGVTRGADRNAGVSDWTEEDTGWQTDAAARRYALTAAASKDAPRWLRYRHIIPTTDDWTAALDNPARPPRAHPQAELITDFCGYNAYEGNRWIEDGVYWVGDLTVHFDAKVTEAPAGSTLLVELVEGNRRYRCRFQLDSGQADLLQLDDLTREDEETVLATATTKVRGTGRWNISFANVDDRLALWIDGKLVDFGKGHGVEYAPFAARVLQHPWEDDLTPVGIAAQGAGVEVSKLLLQRDIYYRGEYVRPQDFDLENPGLIYKEYLDSEVSLRDLRHDPAKWGDSYEKRWIRNDPMVPENAYVFELGPDEFFMMGDNSPRSKDSRLWPQRMRGAETAHRHAVKRTALVGKAFFIYWPHGVPFLNDGRGFPDGPDSFWNNRVTAKLFYHTVPNPDGPGTVVHKDHYPANRVPFYPNLGRMERIR